LLLLLCVGFISAYVTRYVGEQVIDVEIRNGSQVKLLETVLGVERDVWTRDGTVAIGHNHVRVNSTMKNLITSLGFNVENFIEDIQKLIDQETREQEAAHENPSADFFTTYHTLAELLTFAKDLSTTYPDLVTFIPSIGKSIEKRDIFALRIFGGGQSTDATLKFWFHGGQHAREWISTMTVYYIINKLLSQYAIDTKIRNLLNSVEIVVVPMMNPDGFEYARTNTRLWRKNRRLIPPYAGVDLNRNWDIYWGQGQGSSPNPSSDVYRGTAPFSEPESSALSTFLGSLNNVIGAIDWHSYSQLILRPYGWTLNDSPYEKPLFALSQQWAAAIKSVNGLIYDPIKSAQLYYTDGTASDWFFKIGIYGAFTVELRDTGMYGFILPPSQIIPCGEENYVGALLFIQTVLNTHP